MHASFDQLLTVEPPKSERGLLEVGVLLFWVPPHFGSGGGRVGHLCDCDPVRKGPGRVCVGTGRPRGEPAASRPDSVFKPRGALPAIGMQMRPDAGQSPRPPVGLPGGERRARPARRCAPAAGRRGRRRPAPPGLRSPDSGRRAARPAPAVAAAAGARRGGPGRGRASHCWRRRAPPAMPRAASTARRRGLNLASAWSPASGGGECGAGSASPGRPEHTAALEGAREGVPPPAF